MKAYLIDPFARQISEVTYNGHYTHIYELIRNDHSPFTVVALPEMYGRDCIFVDDEGLFKEGQRYFHLDGYPQPLAGCGLVLGTNRAGDSIAPQKVTLENLAAMITWADERLRFVDCVMEEGVMDDPVLGRVPYLSNTPVFTLEPEEKPDVKE